MGQVKKKVDRTWTAREDQIVLLAAIGAKEREIAEQFGIHRSTVGRIVNDPRGQAILQEAKERLREKVIQTAEEELDILSKVAVKALSRTLHADIAPTHKAKSNQDRVALKLLGGRGFLPGSDGVQEGGLAMSDEQFSKLMGAIAKSDRVKDIDPFAGKEVLDAEVVDEDDGGN